MAVYAWDGMVMGVSQSQPISDAHMGATSGAQVAGAFTPEPWELIGDDSSGGVPYYQIEAGISGTASCRSIAQVECSFFEGETVEFRLTPEDLANARLIAAAPDMATDGAFLLDRLDEFERSLIEADATREFCGHVSPAIARFRVAIAKATVAA